MIIKESSSSHIFSLSLRFSQRNIFSIFRKVKMAIVVVLETVFLVHLGVGMFFNSILERELSIFFSSLSLCSTLTYLFSSPVLILLNVLETFDVKEERVVLNKHEEKEFESRKSGMSRTINMTLSLSLFRSPFSRTPSFFFSLSYKLHLIF